MKFLKLSRGRLHFQIEEVEREMLFQLIGHYPLVPQAYHRASLNDPQGKLNSTQQLLEESLKAHHSENRRQIEALLNARGRFKKEDDGLRFSLTPAEAQVLLQAMNDVRVGSWLILGQPDEQDGKPPEVTKETAPYLWAMELCAYFQMTLIRALDASSGGHS